MRRRLLIVFLCCALLVSCGFRTTTVFRGFTDAGEPYRLYNLRIDRWGERRFSGLLALQRKTGGLCYALLDASGITLLEAEIASGGEQEILQGKTQITETKLPVYLGTALYRVFGLDPEEYPCSFNGVLRFCLDSSPSGGWSKRAEMLPFTVWSAHGGGDGDRENGAIVYEQPWGGVKITLEQVER